MKIKNFIHKKHWNRICEIHDAARPGELEGSAPEKAFVPLEKCYEEEAPAEEALESVPEEDSAEKADESSKE